MCHDEADVGRDKLEVGRHHADHDDLAAGHHDLSTDDPGIRGELPFPKLVGQNRYPLVLAAPLVWGATVGVLALTAPEEGARRTVRLDTRRPVV